MIPDSDLRPVMTGLENLRIMEESLRTVVGMHTETTIRGEGTRELWQRFRPRIHEINGRSDQGFVSVQEYPEGFDKIIRNPGSLFRRWAAVEVESGQDLPAGMELLTLPSGLYVAFTYRGLPSEYPPVAAYVIGTWIPEQGLVIDDRPHYELLGVDYSPADPASSEEIRIPVRRV